MSELQLRIKLFASYREAVGQREISVATHDGATVEQVLTSVARSYPQLVSGLEAAMVAVNHEYVDSDWRLQPGDEVALIPPVSGGAPVPSWADERRGPVFRIVDEPLDASALAEYVRTDECGAVCTFLGVARRFSRGREVVHLEYEAYPEMAERKMRQIAEEIRERWDIERVAMLHRSGELAIGEASVAIAVASPHRREAFEACQYAIDRLKTIVPIWKKEVWSNGEQWIGWEGEAPTDVASAKPQR